MNTTLTTEERFWAVISHLSTLALGMGILLPIVGWSDQRRKSNYASFQCLQALGYQSLGYTVWALLAALVAILFGIVLLAGLEPNGAAPGAAIENSVQAFVTLMSLLAGLYIVPPVIAAAACAFGKDFHYPFMGQRLARYLRYDPAQHAGQERWLEEEHEFRWVAAMGHFSILVILWGMLAPLTTWLLFGKRNSFLRFQSIQTLLFQALTTLFYIAGLLLYLTGLLSLLALLGPDLNSTGVMSITILFLIGFLVITLLLLLVIPLLHILGQWAGYRVLKGDNYRYPLVGLLVQRWMSKRSLEKEKPT